MCTARLFEVPVVSEYLHYLGPWWLDEHTVCSISTVQEGISRHRIGTERGQGRAVLTGVQGDSHSQSRAHSLQDVSVKLRAQATSRSSRLVPIYLLGTDLCGWVVLQAQCMDGRQVSGEGAPQVVQQCRGHRHVVGNRAGDPMGGDVGLSAPDAAACLAQQESLYVGPGANVPLAADGVVVAFVGPDGLLPLGKQLVEPHVLGVPPRAGTLRGRWGARPGRAIVPASLLGRGWWVCDGQDRVSGRKSVCVVFVMCWGSVV